MKPSAAQLCLRPYEEIPVLRYDPQRKPQGLHTGAGRRLGPEKAGPLPMAGPLKRGRHVGRRAGRPYRRIRQPGRRVLRLPLRPQGLPAPRRRQSPGERIEGRAAAEGHAKIRTDASLTARPFFERRGYAVLRRQCVHRAGQVLVNFAMERSIQK